MLALLLATAFAGKIPLTVQVTGPDGGPLPATMIRFHDEGTFHLFEDTGTFTTGKLDLPGGTQRDLAQGGKVSFDVFAPGYGPMMMVVELKPGKRNRARARLTPSQFHPGGSQIGREAVQLAREWDRAQLTWWGDRSEVNLAIAERLRAATASKARQWLSELGEAPRGDASRLCRISAPDLSLCGIH